MVGRFGTCSGTIFLQNIILVGGRRLIILLSPNVLAAYFPWLNAIVYSLGAGFMEDACADRAVPLASVLCWGNALAAKNIGLLAALILQALIFGAAHANYPAQLLRSRCRTYHSIIIFGCLYLAYGLLQQY